jgi:hypothetical protein
MRFLGSVLWCAWNAPHAGCKDLLWVSDLYDYATGFLGLGSVAFCMSWIAVDEWRKGVREYGYAALVACTLALIVLTAGFMLPTLE